VVFPIAMSPFPCPKLTILHETSLVKHAFLQNFTESKGEIQYSRPLFPIALPFSYSLQNALNQQTVKASRSDRIDRSSVEFGC